MSAAKKKDKRVPVDEQPIALAKAEEAGTLPAEDRREEPVVEAVVEAVMEAPVVPCATCVALDKAGIGSALDKQAHGWKLKLVDGGTVVLTEGQTITEALFGHVAAVAPQAAVSAVEEAPPIPSPVTHVPILKRGDGTPLEIIDGNMVPRG